LLLPGVSHATPEMNPGDLLSMSLEQLSNIEVTSVSKKAEKASEAAAAIYVISQDDIRRSGATSIPEVLRVVPGLSVAQSGSHGWAISSRGSSDQFSNKLLVLIDGRSVYTPLFSGVYWDVQDTMMQDIERIEVIRGPGATLWGANAVNGVINIITKDAKNTVGGLASTSFGNQEKALVGTRYGAKIGDGSYARVYAKYDDRHENRLASNLGANDQWNKSQGGFRADMTAKNGDKVTFQGDVYRAGESSTAYLPNLIAPPYLTPTKDRELLRGANVLGRWNHTYSKESNVTLQMYVDNTQRDKIGGHDERNTFDFDFQHAWTPHERHEVVWGTGYRLVRDNSRGTQYLNLMKTQRSDNLYSAFVQDKIALLPESVFLTLGSKFEHNNYTGVEVQPSARMTWLVDNKQTLWSSVSRAVRTPNRAEDDINLVLGAFPPSGPLGYLTRVGDRSTESETMTAYEAGYRIQATQKLSFDLSTFYNDYDNLTVGRLGTAYASPYGYLLIPVYPQNTDKARSYGFELASNWQATSYLDFSAGYSFLDLKFDQTDAFGFSFAGKSPEQQFNIRSTLQLPHNVEINNALYYVDCLNSTTPIPQYVRFDTRIAWKATDNLELSLVGQNLLDDSHPEFTGFLYEARSEVPRSIYANATLKF